VRARARARERERERETVPKRGNFRPPFFREYGRLFPTPPCFTLEQTATSQLTSTSLVPGSMASGLKGATRGGARGEADFGPPQILSFV